METILAPLDLQLDNMWKQPPSPATDAKNSLWSPRLVGMSDVLSSQVSPLKEKGLARLPSIGVMINRDASPESFSPVQSTAWTSTNSFRHQDGSPRQPELELNSLLADAAVSQLNKQQARKILPSLSSEKGKRTSNAKLCGMADCNKRAKAGGFCIAQAAAFVARKRAALSTHHGGGKRCTVEGCLNASRKNGVCWSHGARGLQKGPKSGGYCWSHGGKMKK
ncbi:hypothetical protein GQ600_4480 [Phytophthora cactorum]|nr:hypothetical protein GQ600_4480 [Phytophthora cactorum]